MKNRNTVRAQLWERFAPIMLAEQDAFRWLASARRSGRKLAKAERFYEQKHRARLEAENTIRAEMHLPLLDLDPMPRKTKTAPAQFTQEALAFFDEAAQTLANLAARWADEHDYEDLQDYQKPLAPIAERCGVVIDRVFSIPPYKGLGVIYTVGDRVFEMQAVGDQASYKRTK